MGQTNYLFRNFLPKALPPKGSPTASKHRFLFVKCSKKTFRLSPPDIRGGVCEYIYRTYYITIFSYRPQVLPSWNAKKSGTISFKFRTNEANGLILYNGGIRPPRVSLLFCHYNILTLTSQATPSVKTSVKYIICIRLTPPNIQFPDMGYITSTSTVS